MSSLRLKSPAKVNLYIKVVNKRPDGFHNISTIFQRIDLFDDIDMQSRADGNIKISCNHPDVPLGPKNLVYKVAKLIKEEFGIKRGVNIKIHKNIPVAAGLAGGSSNAATVIKGLNQLWKLGLSRKQLVNIAQKIGSDVAFFLYDCSWAWGTQRGDLIKPLSIKVKLFQVLVVPRVKMYTWKVYGGLNLGLTKQNDNVNILIRNLRKSNFQHISALMKNDLESVSLRLCPKLFDIKEQLKSLGCKGVMVSGSGPCVYGLVASEKEGQSVRRVMARRFKQTFVCQTL